MFEIEADKASESSEENQDRITIVNLLSQIKKLKIVWYKHLKKLKLLDEFKEVLQELGILAQVDSEMQGTGAGSELDLDEKSQ